MKPAWRSTFFPIAFVLAGFLIYAPAIQAGFLSDDYWLLGRLVESGPFRMWMQPGMDGARFFRPLSSLALAMDRLIWNSNPMGFHITNVLLHLLNAALVGAMTKNLSHRMDPRANHRCAWTSAWLFLVIPSHNEAVAWIAGRMDLLATSGVLGGILFGCMWLHRQKIIDLIMTYACLMFGLFAKESAVVLPLCILALFFLFLTDAAHKRRIIIAALGLFVLTGVALCLRALMIGTLVGGYGLKGAHLPLLPYGINGVKYLIRVWFPPMDLWGAHPAQSLGLSLLLFFLMATLAIHWKWKAAFYRNAQYRRLALFCALAFVGSILPVLPISTSLRNSEGERFLYLPSVFAALFLASIFTSMPLKFGRYLAPLLIIVYGAVSLGSNTRWKDAGLALNGVISGIEKQVASMKKEGGPIVLLNLPDHIRGAYVFRNGLADAMASHHLKVAPSKVEIAAFCRPYTLRALVTERIQDQSVILDINPKDGSFAPIREPLSVRLQPKVTDASIRIPIPEKDYHPEESWLFWSRNQLLRIR